jgi:hypothetical protein
VIFQSPSAGTEAAQTTTVTITQAAADDRSGDRGAPG